MISASSCASSGSGLTSSSVRNSCVLGELVTVRAIAADADAEGARRAALSLRLPDGVQDALAHAFEIAVGAAQVFELAGQGILDVLVLAAAAFEDQLHFDLVLVPTARSESPAFPRPDCCRCFCR